MRDTNLGVHLILDLFQCSKARIDHLEYVYEALVRACNKTGLHIVDSCIKVFNPHGLSVLILLEESHISFHSFPENNAVAIDLYSCGDSTKLKEIGKFLKEMFAAEEMNETWIQRRAKPEITPSLPTHEWLADWGEDYKDIAMLEEATTSQFVREREADERTPGTPERANEILAAFQESDSHLTMVLEDRLQDFTLEPITEELCKRVNYLVGDLQVDLNESLNRDDE